MKSPSETAIVWLTGLANVAGDLPREGRPRAYWSQRAAGPAAPAEPLTLAATAERIKKLAQHLEDERYFARTLGFDCVDDRDGEHSSISDQLSERVGKPDLWELPTVEWTVDDLCDVVEVLHDLVARPTEEQYHDFGGCGWHPVRSSIPSGRRVLSYFVNEILDASVLNLRLAETGEDAGCVVRTGPDEMRTLVDEVIEVHHEPRDEVTHAIAMFRERGASRNDQRLAIVALARVLEERRPLIKSKLQSKDEGTLFNPANNSALRHNDGKQAVAYGDEFLSWIFYYYLATIQLTDDLLARELYAAP